MCYVVTSENVKNARRIAYESMKRLQWPRLAAVDGCWSAFDRCRCCNDTANSLATDVTRNRSSPPRCHRHL